MYRLYTIAGSCSTGVHTLLNKLGQEVEIVHRDDVPNYQELVPTNQVPALEDGDLLLTEGAAIVMHLLGKHDPSLLEGSSAGEFRQWLLFNYATLHATYSKLFMAGVTNVVTHAESRELLIEHVASRLTELWSIVEERLEHRDYIVGEEPTVIDYLLAVYANWNHAVPEAKIEIGTRSRRLIERIAALPEFARAMEREGVNYRLAA